MEKIERHINNMQMFNIGEQFQLVLGNRSVQRRNSCIQTKATAVELESSHRLIFADKVCSYT